MSHLPLSILIADDDFEDLELIEESLLKADPSAMVHKVATGKEVLQYLSDKPDNQLPCLIVLDYNMPELNGSEVLLHISKDSRYSSIPKVILSTSSSPTHIHECKRNGAIEYFVKPTSLKELEDLSKKMLSYCDGQAL